MPHIDWSGFAIADLRRLDDFLLNVNPTSADKAARLIQQGVRSLAAQPSLGRPVRGMALGTRQLVLRFGRGAYIVLYRVQGDRIQILRLRHSREFTFPFIAQ